MKIDELVKLLSASTNETSKVDEIFHATTRLREIVDGSLFISSDRDDIDKAIKKGAKAFIYQGDLDNCDLDLAWIRVDDIKLAALKLANYVVDDEEAIFYYFSKRELTFYKMITLDHRDIEYLGDDWREIFERVLNSKKRIFIGTNKELMQDLSSSVRVLSKEAHGYIISDTLFRTTFRVHKYVYQYKEFSPIFIDTLLRVVNFCDENHQRYSIDRVRYFNGFMPIFIDKEPKLGEFSNSDRVVIVCDDLNEIQEAKEYTKQPNRWIVKSVILTPPKIKLENNQTPIYYRDDEDLVEILKKSNYNFAFVYSSDFKIIDKIKSEFDI